MIYVTLLRPVPTLSFGIKIPIIPAGNYQYSEIFDIPFYVTPYADTIFSVAADEVMYIKNRTGALPSDSEITYIILSSKFIR